MLPCRTVPPFYAEALVLVLPGSGSLAKLQLVEISQNTNSSLGGLYYSPIYVNNDTPRFDSSRCLIETRDERLSHVGDHPIPVSTRTRRAGL
jgi:hypothetical protein